MGLGLYLVGTPAKSPPQAKAVLKKVEEWWTRKVGGESVTRAERHDGVALISIDLHPGAENLEVWLEGPGRGIPRAP